MKNNIAWVCLYNMIKKSGENKLAIQLKNTVYIMLKVQLVIVLPEKKKLLRDFVFLQVKKSPYV